MAKAKQEVSRQRPTLKPESKEKKSPKRLRAFGAAMKERRERGIAHRGDTSQSDLGTKLGFRAESAQENIAKYESGYLWDPDPQKFLLQWTRIFGEDYLTWVLKFVHEKYAAGAEGDSKSWSKRDTERWKLIWRLFDSPRKTGIGGVTGIGDHRLAAMLLLSDEEMLDMEGLAVWEQNFPGLHNCWVIAQQFMDAEVPDFCRAVAENFRRNVRYTFFIPERQLDPANEFDYFKKLLTRDHKVSAEEISKLLVGVPLKDQHELSGIDIRNHDYAVANPMSNTSVGFRCIRKPTAVAHYITKLRPSYAVRLPDEVLKLLVHRLGEYVRELKSGTIATTPELTEIATNRFADIMHRE